MKVVALILFIVCLVSSIACSDTSEEKIESTVEVCKVLKAKYTEEVSLNSYGYFEVVRYFLYSDGYLEEVDVKTYMEFNEGDTLYWEESF